MKKAAFVTIGQSPRTDILSEMIPRIGNGLAIEEYGVLDGLSAEEIAELNPGDGEVRLVTRLHDGTEVVLRKRTVEDRLRILIERLDRESFDMLVVLCTGELEAMPSKSILVGSQGIVDHGLAGIGAHARAIGILVPHPEQMKHVRFTPQAGQKMIVSHADPYSGERFDVAAEELADADFIVMHCMGYTEAQREYVARTSGRPVLLARRMVADAIAQLL